MREDGVVAVKTPIDLVSLIPKGPSSQTFTHDAITEVWDGENWTAINAITATRRRESDPDHRPLSIQARAGVVDVTSHHNMLDSGFEKVAAADVQSGDELALASAMPPPQAWSVCTQEMAELLGLL